MMSHHWQRLGCMSAAMLASCGGYAAAAEPTRIIIVASGTYALNVFDTAKRAGVDAMPGFILLASEDCPGLRPGLVVAVVPAGKADDLDVVRAKVPDAYRRDCRFKPASLASRGVSLLDPSFGAMAESPVNWSSADAIARISGRLLIRPYFVQMADDPREGLRNRIEYLSVGLPNRLLVRDCGYPQTAGGVRYVAVACAGEGVADQPLYKTTVYAATNLAVVKTVDRCAKPRLVADTTLQCVKQAISADGVVTMTTIKLALPK